jgi:hypothetical protein
MDDPINPSIDDQIACVKRELRMRDRVYANNMTPERAREKIAMAAVLKTLEKVRDDERKHRAPELEL